MPRGRTRRNVALRHQRRFSELGIRPEHAQYATVSFDSDDGGRCDLCQNPNLTYLYRLKFEIPADDEVVEQTVIFFPVGSDCIYNWVIYLREMGENISEEEERLWNEGPAAQVRRAENDRLNERRRAQRLEKIEVTLNAPPVSNTIGDRFGPELRLHWASTLGDISIDRLLDVITRIANHWNETPYRPTDPMWEELSVSFNPQTGRRTRRRSEWFCEMCGIPIHAGMAPHSARHRTRNITTQTQHVYGIDRYGRSFSSRRRECCLCGANNHDAFVTPGITVVETPLSVAPDTAPQGADNPFEGLRVAPLSTPMPLEEMTPEFFDANAPPQLDAEVRLMIMRALQNNPPEIVRSIANYAIRNGRVSTRQLAVVRDRATSPADDPNAPTCPVHDVRMRLRSGQYGNFYSCPEYPACRVTGNVRGELRNVPQGHTTVTEPNVIGRPRHEGGRAGDAPNYSRRRTPNLAPAPPPRATRRPVSRTQAEDGLTIRSSSQNNDVRERSKAFRSILEATIREKCGTDT